MPLGLLFEHALVHARPQCRFPRGLSALFFAAWSLFVPLCKEVQKSHEAASLALAALPEPKCALGGFELQRNPSFRDSVYYEGNSHGRHGIMFDRMIFETYST